VGQKISLTLARHESVGDAAAVKELAIKLPNLSTVELERLSENKFNVAAVKEKLKDTATLARGKVRSSLSQAAAEAGVNGGAFAEIVKAFSYDIDFQREIHPGDTLEVLLDKKMSASGQVGGYSNVRYASLTLLGKKHEIYKYKDSWYNAKGNAVKKSLLRTPLDVARITSGFGMRRHPILGYSKMHQGADFGAGTGTPIMAAGDGIVKQKGWVGGYGNFVLIQHNGTYATAYGHMSRFGNIAQGGRVKQGQIIGYVGATGRATGPHLHYEVRANGRQVNPAAKQFNLASGLLGRELANFNARKGSMAKEMASLRTPSKQVASR
jgi:murein DD-endopeptidase MepM/ murein hydrolase activator NlpD